MPKPSKKSHISYGKNAPGRKQRGKAPVFEPKKEPPPLPDWMLDPSLLPKKPPGGRP